MHVSFVADRAVNDERRHRRVDAAAQRADDMSVAHLGADPGRRLLHERCHRPVAGAAADAVREVPQNLEAMVGVDDFRMKQERVETTIRVRHRRNRRVGARRDDRKAGRRRGDEVAVAGPDANLTRHVRKQRYCLGQLHRGVAKLALRRRGHLAAEGMRHQLHPVADAQHRRPDVEDRGIAFRRAGIRHALRPARQDDPDRVS